MHVEQLVLTNGKRFFGIDPDLDEVHSVDILSKHIQFFDINPENRIKLENLLKVYNGKEGSMFDTLEGFEIKIVTISW